MFDRDRWLEILQVVLRNPLRAVLSGLGVSWGIFMLIITIGSTNGLQNGLKADMSNRAENSMFLWSMQTSMPYKGFQRGRRFELTNTDVEYLRQNVSTIDLVSPRAQLGGYRGANNVVRGINTGAFNIYGDTPDYIKIEPIDVYKGRYLNEGDLEEERKICVIGDRCYQILYPDKVDPIGTYIKIQGVSFMVVGVYKSYRSGEDAEDSEQSIYVPLTTFQKAFNYGEDVGWLSILIKNGINADIASDEVLTILKERKSVHPDDPRAFGHWSMAEEVEEMNQIFTGFDIVSFVFGGLVLLAGVIGIVNIMLITVKERTKEIGVRRGIGATPWAVISQIISETVFLTLIAGFAGMIIGVGALEGVNALLVSMGDSGSFRNPEIDVLTVTLVLIVMIFMGALAGLLPASRAVAIKPVDALRAE